MSQYVCEQCGTENATDAQFCTECDFYLGWDVSSGATDGSPLTSEVTVVRETHTEKFSVAPLSAERAGRPDPMPVVRRTSATRPVIAPNVTVENADVVLDPLTGGTFDVRIRNTSSIVDGYTVEAPNAPEWLEISHPEIRLLTDEECVTTVTLVRPRFDVYVQRFRLPIRICSVEDRTKWADAEIVVTVLRVGGPVTISTDRQVLRLRDATTGNFRLRLDNTGSNYPQRYALSGSDPENAVRFAFWPQTVEIPPRKVGFVEVRIDVPAIGYGEQTNRTLTITAAGGEEPIQMVVNVVQERSQAPPDSPVQLQLEPRVTRIRDTTSADVAIIVDNRRGSKDRWLSFAGRDPERRLRFAFSQPQLHVRAGEHARLQVHVEAPMPSPGEEVERSYSVICNDGTDDGEVTGTIVHAASASPITTATIALQPEHISVRNRRRGRCRVTVDNSRGAAPLHVWLSGANPEGAVRFAFTPARLDIPPGGVGRAGLRVEARLPGGGQEVVREIKVKAEDNVGAVEAEGRFTQAMSEIWPILRLALTLIGGLLAVLGAMRPWFSERTYYASLLPELKTKVRELAESENPDKWGLIAEAVSQPTTRALVLVLAAVMMLGILSSKGTITMLAGFLIAMLTIGYSVYVMTEFDWGSPAYGVILAVLGAVAGIAGGFCVKRGGL